MEAKLQGDFGARFVQEPRYSRAVLPFVIALALVEIHPTRAMPKKKGNAHKEKCTR